MTTVTVRNIQVTGQIATALVPLLGDRALLQFTGHLGAGKTAFVQALAAAVGVTEQVRSPTYTVAHSYALPAEQGTFAHLDLYRSQGGLTDEAWADIEPYFDARYVCVEWPDPLADHLMTDRSVWRLALGWPDDAPTDARLLRVDAPDRVTQARCADALAGLLR